MRRLTRDQANAWKAAQGVVSAKPKGDRRGPDVRTIELKIEAVERAIGHAEYESLNAESVLCAWLWFHDRIYGVSAVKETSRKTWIAALQAARRLVDDEFQGDAIKAYIYVRWAAGREATREEGRRQQRRGGRRLGWRDLFVMRYLLTDFRVAVERGEVDLE